MYPKCTPHRPGRLPQKGGGPVLREQQANDREITTLRSRMQPKLSSGPPLGRTSKTTNLTFGNVNCKPHKPQPDWLLYAHVSGKWAKKTRGTVHYFGNWEEAQKALKEYVAVKCYGLHSDRTFGVIWTELSSQFGSFITPTIRSFPAPRLPQAAPRLLYPAPRFFAKTSYPALPRPFFRPVAWFSWFDGVPGVEVPRMKWCVREFAAPKKNSRRFMSS